VVTGAAGFIGRALVERLRADRREVRAIVRESRGAPEGAVALGALEEASPAALAGAFAGADAVVHLAARAHRMGEQKRDLERIHRAMTVESTARIARAAVDAGVRRFVLASSVKVNGEASPAGHPFGPDDVPAPADAYARGKRAAEVALADAAERSSMAVIVLRLPLVVGPGARGNVARLVDAVAAGRTLPFGAIDNRRSVVGLANLCDAFVAALDAVPPPAGVHFVADDGPVSTPALVRSIARALGVPVPLAYVPVPLLALAGRLAGRRESVDRVTGTLEVDDASFRAATGWRPLRTLDEELARVAAALKHN
jgi:nucleoside-diphosphate-sugar epimerase